MPKHNYMTDIVLIPNATLSEVKHLEQLQFMLRLFESAWKQSNRLRTGYLERVTNPLFATLKTMKAVPQEYLGVYAVFFLMINRILKNELLGYKMLTEESCDCGPFVPFIKRINEAFRQIQNKYHCLLFYPESYERRGDSFLYLPFHRPTNPSGRDKPRNPTRKLDEALNLSQSKLEEKGKVELFQISKSLADSIAVKLPEGTKLYTDHWFFSEGFVRIS